MNRFFFALLGSLILSFYAVELSAQTRKPNVIVILADDLGYADLGAQGGKDIPTPNIDSIANSGVRLPPVSYTHLTLPTNREV